MGEVRSWRQIAGKKGLPPQDPMVAEAVGLFDRLEQAKRQQDWTPFQLTERWRRLNGAIERRTRRRILWTAVPLAAAVTSIGMIALAPRWSHRSSNGALASPSRIAATEPLALPAASSATKPLAPPAAVEPWAAWPLTHLGSNGELRVAPGSRVRLPDQPAMLASEPGLGYRIQLDEGGLCAEVNPRKLETEGPFTVVTSQLEVTVVGTHFCVEAKRDLSEVSVQHGRVRVQTALPGDRGQAVLLTAGESIRSDSPRLNPVQASRGVRRRRPTPGIVPIAVAPVASAPQALAPELQGDLPDELDAENTLYRGAVHARHANHHSEAVDLSMSYLRRYPAGLYAPEVGALLASELAAQ